MKAKRFIIEYANSKVDQYEKLKKKYPENTANYNTMESIVYRAVWLNEHGYITNDETIRMILESADDESIAKHNELKERGIAK